MSTAERPASLRAEVAALLPAGAFLRVDRTERALYVTRADADTAELRSRGWRCEVQGAVAYIAPGLPQLEALRGPVARCPLGAERFASLPPDEALLPLFAALLRACELRPDESRRQRLEKQLRQAIAVALRTGTGGGLEVCAALFARISPSGRPK